MLECNLITSISGQPKSGKTFLSMTFPDPIKVFSFDLGATYVANKFFPKKKIVIDEIALPIIETEGQYWAIEPWKKFIKDIKEDCESGEYNTIVLDTATVVWQMCHQAVTEERVKQKLAEVKYYEPNLRMSSIFARVVNAGVNLVTIQYVKEKYVDGDNTGELVIDGWNRTEGNADVNIQMESVTLGKGSAAKTVMRSTIKNNRFERSITGNTFDDMTYSDLMILLGL